LHYLFIKIAKIDPKKYFILGSYALRGHRIINDLDINIERNEFMKLLELVVKKGFGSIEFYNGQIRWFYELTDYYNKMTNSNINDFSIEAFQKDSVEVVLNTKIFFFNLFIVKIR